MFDILEFHFPLSRKSGGLHFIGDYAHKVNAPVGGNDLLAPTLRIAVLYKTFNDSGSFGIGCVRRNYLLMYGFDVSFVWRKCFE